MRRSSIHQPRRFLTASGLVGVLLIVMGAVSAAQVSEDPPAESPETPDIEVRALLDSSEDPDWVRGLTLLLQAVKGEATPPDWTRETLIEYLTERANESPARTRAILGDAVMQTRRPGEEVLIFLLLGDSSYEFIGDVRQAITRIASERERRDELAARLSQMNSGSLFERLFSLVAEHEPGRHVGLAIHLLESAPEEMEKSIHRALREFTGIDDKPDTAAWQDWWRANGEDSVLRILIENARRESLARTAKMWDAANRYLAGGPPVPYLSWLHYSLQPEQPAAVRNRALQEIDDYVPRLGEEEPALTIEQQQELLLPLLARLQEIISREAAIRDPDPARTRLRALRALGSLTMFRDDPRLAELLSGLITELPRAGYVGESSATRVGIQAVRVAGAMSVPVGPALDAALKGLIPAQNNGPWSRVPQEPLDFLLESLKQVGTRSETLVLLERIYTHRPDSRADVLEVLVLGSVPSDSAPAALAIFERALGDAGSESLRILAINGIGRLGIVAGIDPLREAIRAPERLGRAERSAAINSIESIGGAEALQATITLLEMLPEADDLRVEIFRSASRLCAADESFALLELFLFDAEGDPRDWYDTGVQAPEIEALIAPGQQPADFRRTRPEASRRWREIQAEIWARRAAKVLEGEDLAAIAEGLGKVHSGLRSVLSALGSLAEDQRPEGARLALESLQLTAGRRSEMAGHLVRRDTAALWATLGQLLEAEAELIPAGGGDEIPLADGHILWLINVVIDIRPLEDERQFVADLNRFAERHRLEESERARLAVLEARIPTADPGGAGNPETPPSGSGDGKSRDG